MPLDDQIAQRRANFQAICDLGVAPYPNAFDATASVSALVERHGASPAETLEAERPEVRVAGRVLGIRAFGKAAFLVLSDGRSTIQAYVRQDAVSERDWAIYKALDFGDQVGVSGRVFRSKTNELSVWASSLAFLAKCFLPLPEKWHGLQDVETRYRQRYLDLIVNPDSRRVFEIRSRVVSAIREFLTAREFLEVETPMMQPIAGGALARPFSTHHNALDMRLYLRIAPELYLKRLTVGGIERVFEINRNFRNEGISTQHNPEFTMLEFYQAYADYSELIDLTEDLLSRLVRDVTGGTSVTFRGETIDFSAPFARHSMAGAIAHFSHLEDMSISESDLDDRDTVVELIRKAVRRHPVHADGTHPPENEKPQPMNTMSHGKLIAELFETIAEKHLVQPTFITDFPVEVSPLSKQRPDDPRFVERFELYVGGMEVANAFSELNDPDEQARRFLDQIAQREQGDDEAHRMDEDYVRALEFGMPPTGGEGIGIDRLVMILTDSPSIRDVILFPLMRPRA